MPNYTVIKMKNLSPLHIGTGRENYDSAASSLHSDTISAALASMRALRGRKDDLEVFLKSFSLSSAFPFWEEVYFLPKIQGKLSATISGMEEHEYRKKLKSISYIASELWAEAAAGKPLQIKESQIQSSLLIPLDCQIEKLVTSQVNQRVSVPRDGSVAKPFFFDWHFYNPQGGLYCLTDATGDLLKELLEYFNMLGEMGIGTDKNVGGGKFEVAHKEITLAQVANPDASMLLSLYIPSKNELPLLNLNEARYSILSRGGYIAGSEHENLRHLQKKRVYMFGEGSVFPTTEALKGEVVNLRPEPEMPGMHAVYRSGRPFVFPVKLNTP